MSMDYINYGICLSENHAPTMVDRLNLITETSILTLKHFGNLLIPLELFKSIASKLYKEKTNKNLYLTKLIILAPLKIVGSSDNLTISKRKDYNMAVCLFKNYIKDLCGFKISLRMLPAFDETCADCVILEKEFTQ